MEVILADLSSGAHSSLTYGDAYSIVFQTVITSEASLLSFLDRRVREHFASNIASTLERCLPPLDQSHMIFMDYERYFSLFVQLFQVAERYFSDFCVRSLINNIFTEMCRAIVSFNDLEDAIVSAFEFFESNWQFSDKDDTQFKCWVAAVKFAQLVFPVDFGPQFCRTLRAVAADFLAKFTDPIDFIRVLLDDLKFQEHFEYLLCWSKSSTGQLSRVVYDTAFENPGGVVDQFVQEVSKSLVRREMGLVSLVYSAVAFCHPSLGTLAKLAAAAKAALVQEKRELVELSGTITWYVNLIKKSLGNSILHEFQSDLIEFLALEKRSLFRDLLKFIESEARRNGNLSEVFPVLLYLPGKSEFDILYIRSAVRRLLPLSESQIEIERSFANSIRKLSSNFELKGLPEILHEVQVSLELRLGPVLLVPSGLWPFRIQKATPVALAGYCRSVTDRYSQLFPARILSFPIVEWVVHVKDRVT
jgi:hypothetical protein